MNIIYKQIYNAPLLNKSNFLKKTFWPQILNNVYFNI